ncbi:hypothetical protein EW146_g2662 [Bondarzewia mesenterica]|uniref:Uncharacterized protein n=1 Tax=Bondarzewia mesenterica TaxID=1095465 RepID=A0A4S4LZX7_9AGAM|nr:hypothetical protein EW146_g2662 [Bondarzewia mesenterica]
MAPAPGSTDAIALPSSATPSPTLSQTPASVAAPWYEQLGPILPFIFVFLGIFVLMISTFATILYRARRGRWPPECRESVPPRALLLPNELKKTRRTMSNSTETVPLMTSPIATLVAQTTLLSCAPIKYPCSSRELEKQRGWPRVMSTMSMDFVCRGLSWGRSTVGRTSRSRSRSDIISRESRVSRISRASVHGQGGETGSYARHSGEPLLDDSPRDRGGLRYSLRLADTLDEEAEPASWLEILLRDELEDIPEEDETPSEEKHDEDGDEDSDDESEDEWAFISFPIPPVDYVTHTPTGEALRPYKSFTSLALVDGIPLVRPQTKTQMEDLVPRRSGSEPRLTPPSPALLKPHAWPVDSQQLDLADIRDRAAYFTFAHTSFTLSSIDDDDRDSMIAVAY